MDASDIIETRVIRMNPCKHRKRSIPPNAASKGREPSSQRLAFTLDQSELCKLTAPVGRIDRGSPTPALESVLGQHATQKTQSRTRSPALSQQFASASEHVGLGASYCEAWLNDLISRKFEIDLCGEPAIDATEKGSPAVKLSCPLVYVCTSLAVGQWKRSLESPLWRAARFSPPYDRTSTTTQHPPRRAQGDRS